MPVKIKIQKRGFNSPPGNILGIFAVASAIAVTNLKNCADGAAILAGHTLQADVVLAAVLGVGVTREGPSVGQLTGGRAGESVGNLCKEEKIYYSPCKLDK